MTMESIMSKLYFILKIWLSLPVLTFAGGLIIGVVTRGSCTITCDGCCKERKAAECRKQLMNEILNLNIKRN